jgi:hypothetical protein
LLAQDDFCRSVERFLNQRRPDLAVAVTVEDGEFIVRMQLPERPATMWRRSADEPPYDAALGEPWSQAQAEYLALLAEEENTVYLGPQRQAEAEGIPLRARQRPWWRRA